MESTIISSLQRSKFSVKVLVIFIHTEKAHDGIAKDQQAGQGDQDKFKEAGRLGTEAMLPLIP